MPDADSDPDLSAPPDAPDQLDQLLGAAVRAPAELPRFGPGDELLGRFKIERLVGIGGMGSVYLATDPTLERQVALKLHHGADTARLLREAVAMARLAHPNVIAVYEVGEIAGQAFVVMEYVAGTTLRAWHGAAARSTREILAMLLGAGAGLAAAHDAGLVHRDFKPENVLVADGRPRVGDFGLARGSQSRDDDADPAAANTSPDDGTSGKLVASLTRTGAVLGTPAYMAPEQITAAIVDARADQFAFCIVAWELLYGERPFAGSDLGALARAIAAGPRKPPSGARVRTAIRRVLERGLAADPAARYPDMHEFLAALRRASRSRVPLALVGAGLIAAAGLAFVLVPHGTMPSCDDAGAEIANALPRTLPARILAAGGPLAADGSARVATSIDNFVTRYRAVAQGACRAAKIDHAWSGSLYQRSQACLTIRLRTASALLSIDRAAATEVPDLVQITAHLPVLDGCLDPATLAASPALPTDPAQLDAAVTARAQLDAARGQIAFGRGADARAAVARIAGSPVAAQPMVADRLLFVRAAIANVDDRLVESEQLYRDAYFAARAIDDVEVSLPAVAALIQITGEVREDREAAEGWLRNGLADVERAKTRTPEAASSVYTIAAQIRTLQDQPDEGARLARLAVALVEGKRSLTLAAALSALGEARCVGGHLDDCTALENRALELMRGLLGPRHPQVGLVLANMALEREYRTDPEALAFATEAQDILDAAGGTSSVSVARTEVGLAVLIIENDVAAQYGKARKLLDDGRRRLVAAVGADHPDVAQIDGDLALLDNIDGKQAESVVRLRSALAIQQRALGPEATRVADTQYNLAATLRELGRYDEALVAARDAIAINAAHRAGTVVYADSLVMAATIENHAGHHAAAYTDAAAALALPATKAVEFSHGWAAFEAGSALATKDPAHARALLQEARGVFAAIKSDDWVAKCDGLLAHLPR